MSILLAAQAARYSDRDAISTPEGVFSYRRLLDASARVASFLLGGSSDLEEKPVAFLAPPGFHYVAVQWGIWRAGGIAMPLSLFHPRPELEYVLDDTHPAAVIAHPQLAAVLKPLSEDLRLRFALSTEALEHAPGVLPTIVADRRAMILYTSGTTGRPKGVVTTHANLAAQVTSLVLAWGWTSEDRILNVLPLHHVHGIVNVLACALRVGAVCEILPRFDPAEVWGRFLRGGLTLFMAVPTIYVKLIDHWEKSSPADRERMSEACRGMRLMVSGSAALPVGTLEQWRRISGHVLLERYGMTEIGMALSNPLEGRRIPGSVGSPLPGVEVRLTDESGKPVAIGTPGEIEVRGPTVFLEYWNRSEDTLKAFRDGWFLTGDIAVEEHGTYRILGRNSVDILKTGGYKVSALEIEETVRTHPDIRECAVVGVPDPVWGDRVCAALVMREGAKVELESFRAWAGERLAPYKIPREIAILSELPRNAMGKVSKPALKERFQREKP
ncbi:acyl-CoA synthetase [Syntrophobacter fumaroxidans]|uniref:AMP-dependent synthetase and ligase n=1 Tax=Syntrophobacter fumaroxidans (strain DSM 10017 / MPOB) TaxID=335543 RepID=A0LEZ6_SYNFM|nr:acyl-CoA synthetase [Syntrophobacter fumaroxidans]ABK15998.1 AMP-dependent synthetase and ligase [Syntrophobacter fumaroxidans MPOB]